jgi:hypothetical protein
MLGLNINVGDHQLNGILNGALDTVGAGLSSGQSVGQSLGNVASGLVSPYASILGVVGLGGAFQKTFGSVLANGFDLSCWGASQQPSKVKGILEQYYNPYFNGLLSDVQNGDIQSINRFIKDVYVTHFCAVAVQTATKWSKCSAKGLALYLTYMNPLKAKADELIQEFVTNGAKKTTQSVTSNFKINGHTVFGGENKTVSIPVLNASTIKTAPVIAPMIATVPKIPVQLSDLTGGGLTIWKDVQNIQQPLTKNPSFDYDGGELDNVNANKKSPKKDDSFPWWVLLLGLGMM